MFLVKIQDSRFNIQDSDWRLKKEDFKNKLEWWEQTKAKIKSLTIEVSKQLHVTDKQVKHWENTLEKLLENNTDSENVNTELRGKIQGFYEKKAEAARIRSKVN